MPHPSLLRVAAAVVAAVVSSSIPALAQPRPFETLARAVNAPHDFAPPTLGLTFNDAAQAPGKTLVADVTVSNPGGGPLVDFYFVIVLPDGTTAVSAGPGVGAQIGTLANLRSLVPVARSISLASAFPFQAPAFFSYTFTGPEPQGTYTVYFVALAAGALNDGVLGGGDLVASASRLFTVGPNGAPQTDTTRTVAATIAPTGGSVQTSTASGIGLRLAVPAGGLNNATPLTIAPLTAFNDLPGGPLVAGVRAEPSGLRFVTPATLTITLPAGFQAPPFGLTGFVADSDGSNLRRVPVSLVGNVATLQVPHFSVAGVLTNVSVVEDACLAGALSPEHATACIALLDFYRNERRRLEQQGGSVPSPAFIAAWTSVMREWLQSAILPRMTAARFPLPGQAFVALTAVTDEWNAWVDVYNDLFSIQDRSNAAAGQPLGAEIDNLQRQYVLALSATIDAVNLQCLANKSSVLGFVNLVSRLGQGWRDQFPFLAPLPLPFRYCVDIDIQAAPVPVLTPGTPALMPLDIRVRFTDGTELPGIPLAVAITATNATVSPAGGILPTPIVTTVSVTPSATVSVISISAAVAGPPNSPLLALPQRIATFAAGSVTFGSGTLQALVRLNDTLGATARVEDVRRTFASQERSAVSLPATDVGTAGDGYTVRGSAEVTRTITGAAGGLVISGAASTQASVTVDGTPRRNADVVSGISDGYEIFLRVPFDVTPAISDGALFVTPAGSSSVRLTPGVPIRLPAGRNVVIFDAGIRRQYQGLVAGQPMVGQTAGSHSYSLVFSVVP